MNNEILDEFDVKAADTDDGTVADIQGRHGLIPVTEEGAEQLIEKLVEVFGFDSPENLRDEHD